MTFDNVDELKKIAVFHPNAELVLRILVDDSKARLPFGSKFGCPRGNLEGVFSLAKTLKLNIIGCSFHVGSGCGDATSYSDAIQSVRNVFDMGKEYGYDMYLMDIGGGYPGHDTRESDDKFIEISKVINDAVEKFFSDFPNLQVIAEPGRFIATSCGTLATNVIGRKMMHDEEGNKIFHYYINSNLYGIFNNVLFDKAIPTVEVMKPPSFSGTLYKSVIFGQTCDSMDKIADGIMLPELVCGNWLIVRNHGAYTIAAASRFNGFELCDIHYVFTF